MCDPVLENTMENQNTLPLAANRTESDSDRSQSITDACSSLKERSKTEAQQMISGTDTMGKPQHLTDAVSVMKDEIKTEAEQILAPKSKNVAKERSDLNEPNQDKS